MGPFANTQCEVDYQNGNTPSDGSNKMEPDEKRADGSHIVIQLQTHHHAFRESDHGDSNPPGGHPPFGHLRLELEVPCLGDDEVQHGQRRSLHDLPRPGDIGS
jgi:hypothetical protein